MHIVQRRLGLIIGLISLLVSRLICFLSFYLSSMCKQKKILYISDSRGFLVGSPWSYKNHFGNYLISGLQHHYAVLPIINRHKYTTILDGLDFIRKTRYKFDLIVLHLGVVDFSPRARSSAELVRAKKMSSLVKQPVCELNKKYELKPTFLNLNMRESAMYDGEITDAIANYTYIAMIKKMINDIPYPMIAITTNVVDLSWRGNYWRDRPVNMNSYLSVEREFWRDTGISCISLDECSESVRETTMDNIHPSKLGFQKLEQLVRKEIANLY